MKSYWNQKKNVLEKKSQNIRTLFPETFYLGYYFRKLFFKEFFWRLSMMVHISFLGLSGPDRFSRFDVYRLQRNRQKSVVYIDVFIHLFLIGQPSGFLNVPLKRELREQEYL